jgi:transposase
MLGLAVTSERLPVLANVENGNTSDKTWNFTFIRKLRQTLSEEDWKGLLYVADSALITKRNLKYMKRLHLRFVSRLPDLFGVCEEVKQAAWKSGVWHEIGALGQGSEAASYRIQSFERVIDGRPFRLIVVYSSNLDERKKRTLDSTLQKEEERLTRLIQKLEQTEFHCESDARQAIQAFHDEHRNAWFQWDIGRRGSQSASKAHQPGAAEKRSAAADGNRICTEPQAIRTRRGGGGSRKATAQHVRSDQQCRSAGLFGRGFASCL